MRRTWIVISLAAAALAACGGSTQTKTVTVTKTVTAPAQSQASAPPPASSAPSTTPTTTTAPEGETTASTPLPTGIVGADGTYKMRTRHSDYTGENISVDDEFPTDSEWVFTTTCQAQDCTIQVRRELGSGAFKNVTLEPDPDRENVYVGETSGKTGCANEESSPTRQRYSVRLTAPMDVGARSEARTMDVYFTEVARGCSLSRVARGVVSWRGIRKS